MNLRFQRLLRQEAPRLIISVLVLATLLVCYAFSFLQRFELVTYDYRCILKGPQPTDPRLVVIEISDNSIAKIGRWPWDRTWHAALIKILTQAGARAIVFDVIFSERSSPEKDAALADAIKASGRVYLAEAVKGLPPTRNPTLLSSLPEFLAGAKGTGHINLQPDIDGVMRRIPLILQIGEKKLPQLALAVAMDEWHARKDEILSGNKKVFIPFPEGKMVQLPLDHRGNFLIHWFGRWKHTFKHYAYLDVLNAYAASQNGEKPRVPLKAFKNKICFVGTTAVGLFDIRPTPLEPAYPAVGVNLTLLNDLLGRHFIYKPGRLVDVSILFLLTCLLFLIMRSPTYFRSTALVAVVALVYLLIAVALFVYGNFWIPVIYPLLLIVSLYFFITLYNQLSVAIERAKLLKLATRDSLTGLFNVGHFKLLLKAELEALSLRRERSVSILMGDVDNFKRTNDVYGHVMGDSVLREVAASIKANCRALDVAARYGGEEFILMLPGANLEEAFKVGEKIRKAVSQKTFFHESGNFNTSISIGITQMHPDERDIEVIVARADQALYEAKRTGKNRVVISNN